MTRLVSVLGLLVMAGLAYALSNNRRAVRWRVVLWGLGLQVGFAVLILRSGLGYRIFEQISGAFARLLEFPDSGAEMLFGPLMAGDFLNWRILAVQLVSIVIFFSSLIAILYHLGIMQRVIRAMAWVMRRTMGTSGAESLGVAANVFVGPVEAALVVRPYVAGMSSSELMALMAGGMATVAGTVMAIYMRFAEQAGVDMAHILTASVMSAPAALAIAKLMVPETEQVDSSAAEPEKMKSANVIEAAANGAGFGLKLGLSICAMLIAFVSLVALANGLLSWCGGLAGVEGLTIERIFGVIFWPVAWIMGVPAKDCSAVGSLLGTKTVLNEFLAYQQLSTMKDALSERGRIIVTYAICGFANPGTIGIAIAGLGGIAPKRIGEIAKLSLKALIAGTLAAFMTACIAGILI